MAGPVALEPFKAFRLTLGFFHIGQRDEEDRNNFRNNFKYIGTFWIRLHVMTFFKN